MTHSHPQHAHTVLSCFSKSLLNVSIHGECMHDSRCPLVQRARQVACHRYRDMIDIRVIAYSCLACAHSGCIRIIPGDIDADIQVIQTSNHSYHVCAHMWYLRSPFLAHNVSKHSNKPLNIIWNLLKIIKQTEWCGEVEKPSGSYPTRGSGHYDFLCMPSWFYLDFEIKQPEISVELQKNRIQPPFLPKKKHRRSSHVEACCFAKVLIHSCMQ